MNIPISIKKILFLIALTIFIIGSADEKNDSIEYKNREKKTEPAHVFIAEGISITGEENIYNAKLLVLKKKRNKTISKFSFSKKESPVKQKQKEQVVKKNKNRITYRDSETQYKSSIYQKNQFVRSSEQNELGMTTIYSPVIQLHFCNKILLIVYDYIKIGNSRKITFSIRPPPKKLNTLNNNNNNNNNIREA